MKEYWYPWEPLRFRKNTRGMSVEHRGIYRELIDEYMIDGEPLPANDAALAEIARIPLECWMNAKSVVLAFFTEKNGFLFHDTCNEKLDEQDKKSKKRSKASQKAALKRWQHKKKLNMPNACETHCEDDANAMPQNATGEERRGVLLEKEPKGARAIPVPKPDDVPEQLWKDHLQTRKAKKQPMTPTALARMREEAAKLGWTLERALTEACGNGWASFKADWMKGKENETHSRNRTKSERADNVLTEFLAEQGITGENSPGGAHRQAELRHLEPVREGPGAAEEPDESLQRGLVGVHH